MVSCNTWLIKLYVEYFFFVCVTIVNKNAFFSFFKIGICFTVFFSFNLLSFAHFNLFFFFDQIYFWSWSFSSTPLKILWLNFYFSFLFSVSICVEIPGWLKESAQIYKKRKPISFANEKENEKSKAYKKNFAECNIKFSKKFTV